MGCPVPEGLQDRRGRRADRGPGHAVAVARAAARGQRLPVTVKLRSGQRAGRDRRRRRSRTGSSTEAGVAAIAFHPRSAAVHHKGMPDYDLAAELVDDAAGAR